MKGFQFPYSVVFVSSAQTTDTGVSILISVYMDSDLYWPKRLTNSGQRGILRIGFDVFNSHMVREVQIVRGYLGWGVKKDIPFATIERHAFGVEWPISRGVLLTSRAGSKSLAHDYADEVTTVTHFVHERQICYAVSSRS